jgi:hypothetical protein
MNLPDQQASALAAIARALAAKGDTRNAHHMAAAACALGRWTTVLAVVLALEPSALSVLTGM